MRGLSYVVFGAVLWGIAAVFSKLAVVTVGPWTAVFVRSVVFAAIVVGYVLSRGRVQWDGTASLLYGGLAGVAMGTGVISLRFAYSLYDVSRIVPLQRLSVLVTVVVGITLLDESITARKAGGVALAVVAFLLLTP
jgi:transporter family protein